MILITGGAYQGKTEYARRIFNDSRKDTGLYKDAQAAENSGHEYPVIADGADCSENAWQEADIFLHLHLYLKRFPEQGTEPDVFAGKLLQVNHNLIVVTQELGCGVVPMEREDRSWRERSGRVGCAIAAVSREVIRVQCGIPQQLK